jgi:hypothetical protein
LKTTVTDYHCFDPQTSPYKKTILLCKATLSYKDGELLRVFVTHCAKRCSGFATVGAEIGEPGATKQGFVRV